MIRRQVSEFGFAVEADDAAPNLEPFQHGQESGIDRRHDLADKLGVDRLQEERQRGPFHASDV